MTITASIDRLNLRDNLLTQFIKQCCLDYIATFKYSVPADLFLMDEYLRREHQISLYDALVLVINNTLVEHGIGRRLKIVISKDPYNKDFTFSSLAQLICFGNRNVQGTNIVYKMLEYSLSRL